MTDSILRVYNGEAAPLSEVPALPVDSFRELVIERLGHGDILSALFARPFGDKFRLYAVLCDAAREQLGIAAAEIGKIYPSITADCPCAHWFEREIHEQYGIMPFGHPWLKPIRFEPSRVGGKTGQIGVTDFFSMHGAEVHEVAVGPVHAGVIEPGHFRFQCHGETVYHLEISLGYQHRGVERAVELGPDARTIHYMQTLAGDTSIGHSTAYCSVLEALSGAQVPPAADSIRAVAAELERMANHTGDLGALAGDIGFLPTQNYCGRIRGDILNLTALICGNRFGRNLLTPGGVRFDLDADRRKTLLTRLDDVEKDLESAISIFFGASSALARLEGVGGLSAETARLIGLVGPAARACGLSRDVRVRLPYSAYRFDSLPVSTFHTGDCFARAYVRKLEIEQSIGFIRRQLKSPIGGGFVKAPGVLAPDSLAVALTEGWRGEICHVAATNREGRFAFYKVVDPSFHNWFGLAQVLRGQQISDFPLCNKSFNLSYCGHDL
ncbi:MAG: NADH-quinone oxidoreductase subunit C [Deltaproteobacteria bacterium]|nr:NADH-quinone oxidoreductase subunit C [Deltaproteobacteria bacterium]